MNQTKGFFTVATGDEHYYKIAANLLRSYRMHSAEPLPFAILADRENEYTKEFDQVILMNHPTGSYLDKLSLYDYLPFDTGVFIDADCLAYGDLNEIFDHFAQGSDFCCYGRVLPLEDKTGWFNYEDLGPLQSRVSYCVGLHGGIYYIRRGETAGAVFDTAKSIARDYGKYSFKGNFASPGDEPILALSMALCGCKPVPFRAEGICCYWEHEGKMKLDLAAGKALILPDGQRTHLVHWGTRFTRGLLYRKQIDAMALRDDPVRRLASDAGYDWKIFLERSGKLALRVRNKLRRMLRGQR